MKCGSLFSGIGGFDLGFERAGFEIAWQVEIEKFPRKVLRTRFPNEKRYADVRKVGARNLKHVDVICAGVPCQDVSIAGKRAGLAGKRTGLFYEFARVLRELRPAWFVFENVPGLLSSNGGRDFAEVLRVLIVECGYGVSWRVLNSQFFGVAQRRRRVFVVGSLGRPCPAEILFEPSGCGGDSQACREAWQEVAYALASRAGGTGSDSSGIGQGRNTTYAIQDVRGGTRDKTDAGQGIGIREGPMYTLGAVDQHAVAAPLTSGVGVTGNAPGRRREDDYNLAVGTFQNTGHGWWNESDVATTIRTPDGGGSQEANIVAATLRESDGHHGRSSPRGDGSDNLVTHAIRESGHKNSVGGSLNLVTARSITSSCWKRHDEDTDTLIAATLNSGGNDGGFRSEPGEHLVASPITAASGKTCDSAGRNGVGPVNTIVGPPPDPDGVRDFAGLPEGMDSARYRALGNAVTVQVAEWIARRILRFANSKGESFVTPV